MRKFFKLMAVVALALLVATPAMALDFKFGAEYRVRFYDMVTIGFDGTKARVDGNPRGVQLRVRPRFDVSDDNGNMTATLRLEIGDIEWGNGGGANGVTNAPARTAQHPVRRQRNRVGNGAGGSIGADGVNVETKWALHGLRLPVRRPASLPRRPPALVPAQGHRDRRRRGRRPGLRQLREVELRRRLVPRERRTTTAAVATGQAVKDVNTQDNNFDFFEAKADLRRRSG